VFTRYEYADLLVDSLIYCIRHKGLQIYAWCLMPSHLHMVCRTGEEKLLSDVLRDFKSFTAKEIIRGVEQNPEESRKEWLLYLFRHYAKGNRSGATYQFWQHHNHPIGLDSAAWIEEKITYIHQNPVQARIVDEPEHYAYSSAHPFSKIKTEVW
jgi:REP element-mobilizing transposase RayT